MLPRQAAAYNGRGGTILNGRRALSDEIEPYVLVRVQRGEAECAVWEVVGGHRAVALFLTEESARAYRDLAGLAGWQIVKPSREALRELLAACVAAGVRLAALEPDGAQAKRLFNLVTAVGSSPG
jgi:hypothetical protein